tara:strand:+ start:274 stop:516 length:243 start_codon:yes stop_codon:yes gene_type:complete
MDTSRVDGVKASLHDGTPRSHWDLVVVAPSEEIHQGYDPRPDASKTPEPEGQPIDARCILIYDLHHKPEEVHARIHGQYE